MLESPITLKDEINDLVENEADDEELFAKMMRRVLIEACHKARKAKGPESLEFYQVATEASEWIQAART